MTDTSPGGDMTIAVSNERLRASKSVICAADPLVSISSAPAFRRNGFDIYVCPLCGSYVCNADYHADQYSDDYYTIASSDMSAIEGRWGFRWRYILDRIVAVAPTCRRLLDVGAGNGSFVKIAAQEYRLAATGIEISNRSVDFASDVLDVELRLEELHAHDGCYDVVTAFSVIEHVAEPTAFLRDLVDHLEVGGLLVLATPNPGCIQRRVQGAKRWAMICPPHHLNVFSRHGMEQMLTDAGLTVTSWESISTSVKVVRKFDTPRQLLRRAIFGALRATSLGADQLIFATKTDDLTPDDGI